MINVDWWLGLWLDSLFKVKDLASALVKQWQMGDNLVMVDSGEEQKGSPSCSQYLGWTHNFGNGSQSIYPSSVPPSTRHDKFTTVEHESPKAGMIGLYTAAIIEMASPDAARSWYKKYGIYQRSFHLFGRVIVFRAGRVVPRAGGLPTHSMLMWCCVASLQSPGDDAGSNCLILLSDAEAWLWSVNQLMLPIKPGWQHGDLLPAACVSHYADSYEPTI